MKALKILGIVFGILLLLTGGGLAVGSVVASKGQTALDQELAKSGYAGPVDGTVQSIDQTNPVIVTVTYTDTQGKTQTGQGTVGGGQPPQVGDVVSTYYSTSDPRQVVVVNVPGLGDLSGIGNTLRTAAISCLIVGSVLLLAGILGLALGKKQPAPVAPYPAGPPQQAPPGYPSQPYPPQQQYPPQQPGQPYPPQPGQQYPPQQPSQPYPPQPGQQYPPQQPPSQPYRPQQNPPER